MTNPKYLIIIMVLNPPPHHHHHHHHYSCLSSTRPQRKGPIASILFYSECHASKGAERENRQQQQPLFLSMKPSFIPRSLQAVRGALQLTVSVHKQKTQMNKLTAFCEQVRGTGTSEKQKEHEQERTIGRSILKETETF